MSDIYESLPVIPNFSDLIKPIEPVMLQPPVEAEASLRVIDSLSVSAVFESVKNYVQAFEQSLDPEHEVGAKLTSFGQSVTMVVENIQYEEPNILVFDGLVDGHNATLLQHMSQLNFLLVALPKNNPKKPKRKIGFGE